MQQEAPGADARPLTGPDAWVRESLAHLCALPAVSRVGIALAEGGGRRLLFVASDRDNDAGVAWCHIDAYADVPLNTAVRKGVLVIGSLDELAAAYGEFVGHQDPRTAQAIAAVPVSAAGQTLGGFVLFYAAPQPFDPAQRRRLLADGARLGARLRQVQRDQMRQGPEFPEQLAPEGARAATHFVPADPAAVRGARQFLDETLTGWGVDEETTGTAVLCLSELVTNAIIHTHAGCEVRTVLDHGVLTTSVRDSGTSTVKQADADDPLQVHGRGLQVVDVLASRWGSDLDEVGSTVWFVIDI